MAVIANLQPRRRNGARSPIDSYPWPEGDRSNSRHVKPSCATDLVTESSIANSTSSGSAPKSPSRAISRIASRQGLEPLVNRSGDLDVQLRASHRVVGEHSVVPAFNLDDVPADRVRDVSVPRRISRPADQ